jgi:hypothetical protein
MVNEASKASVQEDEMKQAVLCIATDIREAEKEVTTLRAAGFSTDDSSVLWPDMAGAQELGHEQHTRAAAEAVNKTAAFGIHHIEETASRRSKCYGTRHLANTGALLLILLAASAASVFAADEVTPVSPAAKTDEQKATMPPDVTTTTVPATVREPVDTTVFQSQKTSQKSSKTKKCHSTVGCKSRTTAK